MTPSQGVRTALYGVGAAALDWPFPTLPGGPPTAPGVYVFDTQHLLPADRVGFDVVLHVVFARRPAPATPTQAPAAYVPTVFVAGGVP